MITTRRTLLRNFTSDDLEDLYEYTKLQGVGEAAGWKHHETRKEAERMLVRFMENKNSFAIIEKTKSKVIGHINVLEDSVEGLPDTKELGFVLNPVYHKQGIMTEVISAVLDRLFLSDICCVYACCFQTNVSSKRLIEKCGFRFEQEGKFFSASLKQSFDSYEYVMTKENWQTER